MFRSLRTAAQLVATHRCVISLERVAYRAKKHESTPKHRIGAAQLGRRAGGEVADERMVGGGAAKAATPSATRHPLSIYGAPPSRSPRGASLPLAKLVFSCKVA